MYIEIHEDSEHRRNARSRAQQIFSQALRAAGHDVETVTETCRGPPDEVVTQLSVQTRRILLTEDKDFGQLVYAGSGLSLGVILIRFPGNARQGMVKAILELLERVEMSFKTAS